MSDTQIPLTPNERALTLQVTLLQAQLADLKALVAQQAEVIRQLTDKIARLERNSSNSNKPPSSDFVKPPKPPLANGKKRGIGGQPGHQRNMHPGFGPEDVDQTRDHALDTCPNCHHGLLPSDAPPNIARQAELAAKPVIVVEHRAHGGWCPLCQKLHYAPLPATVTEGGLIDPRLQAMIAWLKGKAHASYTTIQEFFKDVLLCNRRQGPISLRGYPHKPSSCVRTLVLTSLRGIR